MNKKIEKLMPAELIALARFCQAALILLNARMFTLLGLLLSAGMFSWVLYEPDWIRAFAACAFSLLNFWPVQRMEANRPQTQGEQNG